MSARAPDSRAGALHAWQVLTKAYTLSYILVYEALDSRAGALHAWKVLTKAYTLSYILVYEALSY
jgi:hypothetical protein